MNNRGDLNTEQQNPRSSDIDSKNVREILSAINNEDSIIANAVKDAIPNGKVKKGTVHRAVVVGAGAIVVCRVWV